MDFAHFIEAMEHSIYAFERPMYSSPPLGIYLFSKRAGEDVKVLTSGEGADEIGGGYPELFGKYYAYAVSERAIPSELDCVNGGMDFIKSFDSLKVIMDNNDDFLVHADLSNAIEKRMTYWKSLTGTPFDKMRKMHFKYRLISMLERQNKVCMSNSVENRVPFLDNKFVDFMFTLPEELLMHKKNITTDNYSERYEGKYILKELSSQVYGKEFAYRKKQAIQVPWGKYFSEPEMIEYINEIIVPGMKKRNFIDMDSFNSRLKHLNDGGNIVKVWKYINFELWCQFFIDGRTEFYQR
jgi:asparagine synthase (glutamine-hydrolysing)